MDSTHECKLDLNYRELIGYREKRCRCSLPMQQAQQDPQVQTVYRVQAGAGVTKLRLLTKSSACPQVQWDNLAPQAMALRVGPAVIAARGKAGQPDAKAAQFDVRTCESDWPAGAQRARVAGIEVKAPKPDIRRIVLLGDTGCRMKASDQAFQACNDAQKWPFAQIARLAADLQPDLVIHIGDIHYRESPCPDSQPGCRNSPWGYGYDTWKADFFEPAQPLLAAAPWVFVRGNHESCWRAGHGWFRFVDTQPWRAARSCNDPALDDDADYTEPYAVRLNEDSQLIVFDSSKTSGKALAPQDVAYKKYAGQLAHVNTLTQKSRHSFFMSHHPLLAYAPTDDAAKVRIGNNAGLVSVFAAQHPQRLLPQGVNVALHGHIHLFEALSFQSDHPISLVLGNSGSTMEGVAPTMVKSATPLYPGAIVDDYAASSEYGFATLDRVGSGAGSSWLLTEYNLQGKAIIQCKLVEAKSRCASLDAEASGDTIKPTTTR